MMLTQDPLVRSAYRIAALNLAWTLVASVAAIGLGLTYSSVALVAFGAVGLVDLASSVALALHFRNALRHRTMSRVLEDRAHRVVAFGLFIVGVASTLVGALHFLTHAGAENELAGLVLALLSMVVLGGLSIRKRQLATQVPSAALGSDAHVSAIGAAQGGIVLFGTAATDAWELDWADPVAAIAIGVVAIALALTTWRQIDAPG